jgi:phosphohistidine phosphatase SixA
MSSGTCITIRRTIAPPDMRRIVVLLVGVILLAPSSTVAMAALPHAPVPTAHRADSTDVHRAPRADIWQLLRTGTGYAVLLRHALAPGTGDPPGFRLGDCSTQRNLSPEGRRQAIAIGAQWRRERMPVARVLTSRWCRARDTARLLAVGPVTAYPALDSSFTVSETIAARRTAKVRGLIARHRGEPGVLVLVGHQVNITDLTGVVPSSGQAVIVTSRADGLLRVVGTLPLP